MGMMAVLLLAPAVAVPALAAGSIVLPRSGQVGVGVQGGWGTLLKSGELGNAFGNGPTLAFRLRYRMRYERAMGLSFEGERFEIRTPEDEFPAGSGLDGRTHVNAILSGLEFYQLFGTRTRTTRMVMVGAGLAQTSGRTLNNDTFFPGDGTYVSVGAGVERFLIRSWALDLSTRYVALFLPDDRNHDLQVALGLIFYASY
jgi:hypothetical protein